MLLLLIVAFAIAHCSKAEERSASSRAQCMTKAAKACFKKFGWAPVCATKTSSSGSWVYAYSNSCEAKSALKCESPPTLKTVKVTGTVKLPAECLTKFQKTYHYSSMGKSCFEFCKGYEPDEFDYE